MAEPAAMLRLLTWLSPAFPTGGFAYSSGLEWAVEAGDVTDEAGLTSWLQDLLSHGTLWSDTVILRQAHRAAPQDLPALAALATALGTSAERRLETAAQGAAFALAAAAWPADLPAWEQTPLPVIIGALAAAHRIAEADTALAFLHNATASLVSAAIRLIPLGQAAGLRVQAALEPAILACLTASATAGTGDLGTACFAADIAAMRHETQHTRLFRT